jgi:hypothetical protein
METIISQILHEEYVECKIIQTSLGNIYFKQLHPYFVTIYPLINLWQTHSRSTYSEVILTLS